MKKKSVCTNKNCGYQWVSKKQKPKACPSCRQYIKYLKVNSTNKED